MTERILLSDRAAHAIRDLMSNTTLGEIDQMWQDEDFPAVAEDPPPVGGQRKTRFQGYINQVDWTDPGQVRRALRVFEVAVRPMFSDTEPFGFMDSERERIRRLFAKDGVTVTDDGQFVADRLGPVVVNSLDVLTDPSVIQDHLDRITRAVVNQDPAQAIGSAKELIESTAKLVLTQTGYRITGKENLLALVRRAQEQLRVHSTQANVGPDGTDSVKKILGATTTIASGVAELRNAGFGTGHGGVAPRSGLGARHARLAVNAARTWCEFILDTLADEKAPWRQNLDE